MAVDLEAMAENAAQQIDGRPQTSPLAPRDRIFGCLMCLGSGLDRSHWRWLWGGNCWVCGGWGFVIGDVFVVRGPFAPRPGR